MSRKLLQLAAGLLVVALLGVALAWYFPTDLTVPQNDVVVRETKNASNVPTIEDDGLPRTEAQWKQRLTPEQYYVLRQKGTEMAFTGDLWDSKTPGTYACAGCGQELFSSETKYESGTGWPSFYAPLDDGKVSLHDDYSLFTRRTEVICSRCEGHLGHVFPDGPLPTGMRYCLNSTALQLKPADEK